MKIKVITNFLNHTIMETDFFFFNRVYDPFKKFKGI